MVLTLYKLDPSPACRATLMVFDMLGLEANHVDVKIMAGEHLQPAFVKKNPIHTIPTLQDDDFTIFDSNVIAAYVVDKYAKDDSLYPKDLQTRAVVNQRLVFNSSILYPALGAATRAVMVDNVGKVTNERRTAIVDAYRLLDALLDSTTGPWLAGDQLTIADICTVSTVSTLNFIVPIEPVKFPGVDAWFQKCSELETVKKVNVPGNEALNIYFKSKLK